MSTSNKFIDVKESIRSKNPNLLKIMPWFVLNYIRKAIHEDQVNQIIDENKHLWGLDFVRQMVYNVFDVKAELNGFGNVPDSGRFIFVANHPWGAMEAVALLDIVSKKYDEPRFIVNDLLMSLKNYQPLFLPVNKHGAQAKENARLLDENFASGRPILIFPAGMVSRKIKGEVMDLEWKKSFIDKARQYKRDIIPVYIDGKNSNFFYTVYQIRSLFGIKANIEMFYLVDEMLKNAHKTLPYHFGKPIPYQTFDTSKSKEQWAELVKQHVYQLKNHTDKLFAPEP
jgi:putative hemolysin